MCKKNKQGKFNMVESALLSANQPDRPHSKIQFWCIALAVTSTLFVYQTVDAAIEFEDASSKLLVTDELRESWGAAWGDLNSDGYPDLYMSNHRQFGQLLVNNKFGGFSNQTNNVDPQNYFKSGFYDDHGAVWGDIDNDGDLDLSLTEAGGVNGAGRNGILKNINGVLTNWVTYENSGVGTMGLLFDINNNGCFAIF